MSRSGVVLGLVGLGFGVLAGCDDPDAAPSPAAQVVEAIVLDVADEVPRDPDKPDALPVVYVVSGSEEPFSAQVQASVASAVHETVDVRFADAPHESLERDRPGAPVRDGGALVQIGKLTPDHAPMDVDIEVYRSETQFSRRVVTFRRRGDEWSASDTSVVEAMDVPPTAESEDGTDEDEDGALIESAPTPSSST